MNYMFVYMQRSNPFLVYIHVHFDTVNLAKNHCWFGQLKRTHVLGASTIFCAKCNSFWVNHDMEKASGVTNYTLCMFLIWECVCVCGSVSLVVCVHSSNWCKHTQTHTHVCMLVSTQPDNAGHDVGFGQGRRSLLRTTRARRFSFITSMISLWTTLAIYLSSRTNVDVDVQRNPLHRTDTYIHQGMCFGQNCDYHFFLV